MKYTIKTLKGLLFSFAIISMISCNTSKKDTKNATEDAHDHSEMNHDESEMKSETMEDKEVKSNLLVLENYLLVKDALVEDDREKASAAGIQLSESFKEWKLDSLYQEKEEQLMVLVVKIEEQGHQISESEIEEQREIFAALSKDMVDLIAITGTPKTLYQQYCPMYKNNTGGFWLSDSRDIRNPLFGSMMLTCGAVQAELK